MKTIGIDCRFAGTHSGLGRYTREVVTHLLKRSDDVSYVLFTGSEKQTWLPKKSATPFTLRHAPYAHYSFAEQLQFPWHIRRAGLDLLFFPHFNAPLVTPVPFVSTIHDLILHRYPNQASALTRLAYRRVMAHTVHRSRALIAVSKFTAGEITDAYGPKMQKKITVIPQAVGDDFQNVAAGDCSPVLKKYKLQKPFFLYVGNAKQHKNVQMLIDAYRSLGTTETELVLVTGGKEAESLKLHAGVRMLSDVSHADLHCLYFFAACFVTASLYEGFGLPVLEATAAHCPVIVTNCGSLPEIAPPGALIVEPTVKDIADALREPPSPSERGTMRSWAEVAAETAAVFTDCLSER